MAFPVGSAATEMAGGCAHCEFNGKYKKLFYLQNNQQSTKKTLQKIQQKEQKTFIFAYRISTWYWCIWKLRLDCD